MSPDFSHAFVNRLNALSNASPFRTLTLGINFQPSSHRLFVSYFSPEYKKNRIQKQVFFGLFRIKN